MPCLSDPSVSQPSSNHNLLYLVASSKYPYKYLIQKPPSHLWASPLLRRCRRPTSFVTAVTEFKNALPYTRSMVIDINLSNLLPVKRPEAPSIPQPSLARLPPHHHHLVAPARK